MPGRFISFEGGEGAGKSTQAARLAATLRARGLDVVETREPGGSEGAEAIRGLLLDGAADRWGAEAEALLFAAARADHVARTIRPALARGATVVCDRFLDSSLAYQGGGGGIGTDAIRSLHTIGSGGLLPDRTILLMLDIREATRRAAARDGACGDRFAKKGASYHRAVASAFGALAAAEPDRIRLVDAGGDADAVAVRVSAAVEDLL